MGTAAATTATLSRPTHAGINIAPQETIDKSVLSVCQQRRKVLGLGVLTPWKYVGGVRVCLTPKYVTFFHSKLLLDNSATFTSSGIKDLCQKLKIFRNARNSLTPRPDWSWPHILRQIYATVCQWIQARFSVQIRWRVVSVFSYKEFKSAIIK